MDKEQEERIIKRIDAAGGEAGCVGFITFLGFIFVCILLSYIATHLK